VRACLLVPYAVPSLKIELTARFCNLIERCIRSMRFGCFKPQDWERRLRPEEPEEGNPQKGRSNRLRIPLRATGGPKVRFRRPGSQAAKEIIK
jgi:hypothetical protein